MEWHLIKLAKIIGGSKMPVFVKLQPFPLVVAFRSIYVSALYSLKDSLVTINFASWIIEYMLQKEDILNLVSFLVISFENCMYCWKLHLQKQYYILEFSSVKLAKIIYGSKMPATLNFNTACGCYINIDMYFSSLQPERLTSGNFFASCISGLSWYY